MAILHITFFELKNTQKKNINILVIVKYKFQKLDWNNID